MGARIDTGKTKYLIRYGVHPSKKLNEIIKPIPVTTNPTLTMSRFLMPNHNWNNDNGSRMIDKGPKALVSSLITSGAVVTTELGNDWGIWKGVPES